VLLEKTIDGARGQICVQHPDSVFGQPRSDAVSPGDVKLFEDVHVGQPEEQLAIRFKDCRVAGCRMTLRVNHRGSVYPGALQIPQRRDCGGIVAGDRE
jgi:hypothetical protein